MLTQLVTFFPLFLSPHRWHKSLRLASWVSCQGRRNIVVIKQVLKTSHFFYKHMNNHIFTNTVKWLRYQRINEYWKCETYQCSVRHKPLWSSSTLPHFSQMWKKVAAHYLENILQTKKEKWLCNWEWHFIYFFSLWFKAARLSLVK